MTKIVNYKYFRYIVLTKKKIYGKINDIIICNCFCADNSYLYGGLILDKNKKIRDISGIVTAVLVILTGITFAINAIVIYTTGGDRPFTRQIVGKHLLYTLPVTIPLIISAIFNFVWTLKFPTEEKKMRGARNEALIFKKHKEMIPAEFDISGYEDITKEETKRKKISLISIVSMSVIGLAALLTALLSEYSLEDINACVIRTAAVVISLGAVMGAIAYISDRFICESFVKETEIIKLIISENGIKRNPKAVSVIKENKATKIAAFAILGIAAVFIIIGAFGDGMSDVLEKAIRICTECIGLG